MNRCCGLHVVLVLVGVCTALTCVPPADPEVETPTLIGTIQSRHYTIHLYIDRFTVEDGEGEILAKLITEDQFAELLPEVYGAFEEMTAAGRLMADVDPRNAHPISGP